MELKGRVLVYSILGCPHCMRAKNTLQELGVPYSDVGLDKFPQARQDLQRRAQKRTVPQIFFNAKHIGGNEDLQNLVICPCIIIVFLKFRHQIHCSAILPMSTCIQRIYSMKIL